MNHTIVPLSRRVNARNGPGGLWSVVASALRSGREAGLYSLAGAGEKPAK